MRKMKWKVEPVKVATKTFYQVRRRTGSEVEKAGGYYESMIIAQRLCEALNADEEDEE